MRRAEQERERRKKRRVGVLDGASVVAKLAADEKFDVALVRKNVVRKEIVKLVLALRWRRMP